MRIKLSSVKQGQNDTIYRLIMKNWSFFPLCIFFSLQNPEKCQNHRIIRRLWANKLGMVIAK